MSMAEKDGVQPAFDALGGPDYRCALQVAGEENGRGAWVCKPLGCALHPINCRGQEISLDAENEIYRGRRLLPSARSRPSSHVPILRARMWLATGDGDFGKLRAVARGETETPRAGEPVISAATRVE